MVVRKQYVVKKKPATQEQEGLRYQAIQGSADPPRVRTPKENQHHKVSKQTEVTRFISNHNISLFSLLETTVTMPLLVLHT